MYELLDLFYYIGLFVLLLQAQDVQRAVVAESATAAQDAGQIPDQFRSVCHRRD